MPIVHSEKNVQLKLKLSTRILTALLMVFMLIFSASLIGCADEITVNKERRENTKLKVTKLCDEVNDEESDSGNIGNSGSGGGGQLKYIMLHETEGGGAPQSVGKMWDNQNNGVAAHFVVGKDGSICQCVPLDKITHHAGFGNTGHNAKFGVEDESPDDKVGTSPIGDSHADYGMNSHSIGIEIVHQNSTGEQHPEAQLKALDTLIKYIDDTVGFQCEIIAHNDWRIGNSDLGDYFTSNYKSNYQSKRTHDGSAQPQAVDPATFLEYYADEFVHGNLSWGESASNNSFGVSNSGSQSANSGTTLSTSTSSSNGANSNSVTVTKANPNNFVKMQETRWQHGPLPSNKVKYIMIHDTEAGTPNATDIANSWGGHIAAHFVIGKDGQIVYCVPINQIAHHAGFGDSNDAFGVTEERDDRVGTTEEAGAGYGMNAWSIGIELCHEHDGTAYPEVQLQALDGLIAWLDETLGHKADIIDHKAWAGSRKQDVDDSFPMSSYKSSRNHGSSSGVPSGVTQIKNMWKEKDGYKIPGDYMKDKNYRGAYSSFAPGDNERGKGIFTSEDGWGEEWSCEHYMVNARWEYAHWEVATGMWGGYDRLGSSDGLAAIYVDGEAAAGYTWHCKQRVLVYNPDNGKAVVCQVGNGTDNPNWGPNPLVCVGGISYKAQEALGFSVAGLDGGDYPYSCLDWGGEMEMWWVDENTPLGPTTIDQIMDEKNNKCTTGQGEEKASAGIEGALQWAEKMADDPNVGYAQLGKADSKGRNRNSIASYDGKEAVNVDCSALVYWSLVKGGGYNNVYQLVGDWAFTTYTMQNVLEKCGWTMYPYSGMSNLKRGDILLNSHHTAWYSGNGKNTEAATPEGGGVEGEAGDQLQQNGAPPEGQEVQCKRNFYEYGWTHYFRRSD